MTETELTPIVQKLDELEASGRIAGKRLREIIIDDALQCPRRRRRYAAIVLRLAEGPPEGLGRFDLTSGDLARTGADVAPCGCGKCGCENGSCAQRAT